jgi:hypothetical protein
MAPLTPSQERTRERVETVIGVMAPALTLLLAVGDRVSRLVQPEDHEYYPARPLGDREPLPDDLSHGPAPEE